MKSKTTSFSGYKCFTSVPWNFDLNFFLKGSWPQFQRRYKSQFVAMAIPHSLFLKPCRDIQWCQRLLSSWIPGEGVLSATLNIILYFSVISLSALHSQSTIKLNNLVSPVLLETFRHIVITNMLDSCEVAHDGERFKIRQMCEPDVFRERRWVWCMVVCQEMIRKLVIANHTTCKRLNAVQRKGGGVAPKHNYI